MTAESGSEGAHLKGLSKHFNSITLTGRANVAKATFAGFGLIIAYFMLKPKKQTPAAVPAAK